MSIVKRLWNWYFCKDLPELEDIPPSGHGEWTRYQHETKDTQIDVPVVQVQPVRKSTPRSIRPVRPVFHPVHLIADDTWLNSNPTTGPINISDIQTQPVQRDTEATLEVPAISKYMHERRGR